MQEGSQPAVGERIILRGRRGGDAPKLVTNTALEKEIPSPRLVLEEGKRDIFEDTDLNDEENVVLRSELTIPSYDPPINSETRSTPTKEENMRPGPILIEELELATTGLFHEVKAGETLYRISINYGVSVEQLKALNQISGNTISIGQRLRIR